MKAAITIGRMNPPTAGHMHLVSQVLQEPADKWALILQGGNLKDKEVKNMFSQKLKSSIIQQLDVVDIDKLEIISLSDAYLPTVCERLGLEKGDELVVILGEEDRERIENQFKYIPDELLEELPKIQIKGVEMKAADEEQRISGTLIRSFIFKNDFDQFFNHFEMQDEAKAKKIFNKLRSAVLSNLKLRFPHKEVDGKLTFSLPKTKAGKLNSAANKIISNILQNLEGYGKEIMWEGILKENPDSSFFDANAFSKNAKTFIVGKNWWAWGDKRHEFSFYSKGSVKKYNTENGNYMHYLLIKNIVENVKDFAKKYIGIDTQQYIDGMDDDLIEKKNGIRGRFWQEKAPDGSDIIAFWHDREEVMQFPLIKEMIKQFSSSENIYVDFNNKWENTDDDTAINSQDSSSNWTGKLKKKRYKNDDRSFKSHHQDADKSAVEKWREKIYNTAGIWDHFFKTGKFLNEDHQQIEVIPQPDNKMTYLNVLHPVNLNKDLISSFRRRNLVVPSTVTDTWGNKVERMGRYEMDSWNRLKNSIRKGGVWPPITVRILDDFTCYIEDGNHRLEAVKELGDQYEKGTMPVQLQIHPSLSFKGINNFFKNWNEVGIIDNRDYTGLLNQLNLLRIEQYIKLPDKIEILKEGGNVFSDVIPFDKTKIEPIMNSVNQVLNKVGIRAIPIGSTTKPDSKPLFGDMDMIVDEQEVLAAFGAKDLKTARKALKNFFEENGITSAQTGVSVHARIPTENSYHQVDLMIVSNAKPISQFHMHDIPQKSPYKGFNKLFIIWYLAKQKGLFWSPFQGLFDTTPEGKKGELLSTDIDEVARLLLGRGASGKDLASTEAILDFLPKEKAEEVLAGVKQDPAWKEVPIQENVLQEGGGFGHMAHGYEVFKGTELFTFFDNIFSGKYEMYEKVDGLNVVWGIQDGKVVFNLGGSQGNISDVEEKYSIYHPAGDAFRAGFQAIREAVERMSPTYMRALGLLNGNMINSEILFGEIPNTVPYSKTTNYIVLHGIMGDTEVKNEKKLLNQLAQEIGQLTVTAPVMNYEGDDLNMVKSSLSMATSKWKFAGPMKINPDSLKEKLGDEVEKWKSYPEAQILLKPDITEDEALEAAKSLSQKVGSTVLSKMVSQLRDPDASGIEGLPGIEGLALYGEEGDLYKLTGDFNAVNRKLWEPISKASQIVSDVWEYIAKDVLGLKTKKVGKDFIDRFGADPDIYLKTKSSMFAKKRGIQQHETNERANVQQILTKIDRAILELKDIFSEISQSDHIKKENILKSLRVNAFKLNRARNILKNATTYSDVVTATAKGMELMESSEKSLKDVLSEKIKQFDKNSDVIDYIEKGSNNSVKNFKSTLTDLRFKPNREDITSQDFEKIIKSLFGSVEVSNLPPGQPPNKSNSFDALEVPVQIKNSEKDAVVMLAKGANKGEKYEKQVTDDLSAKKKNSFKDKVFNQLGITQEMVKAIYQTGATNTKRSQFLDLKAGADNINPQEFGEIIADITIELKNGKNIFISVKNENGNTLYNIGSAGLFEEKRSKIIFVKNTENPAYNIFSKIAPFIDWNKVELGLNDYQQKKQRQLDTDWMQTRVTPTQLKYLTKFLECSWGYGYWYLRQDKRSPDGFNLIPLLTKKDLAKKLDAKIVSSAIKYPSIKNKSLTYKVTLEDKMGNLTRYEFSFRNKSGGILPKELAISSFSTKNKGD